MAKAIENGVTVETQPGETVNVNVQPAPVLTPELAAMLQQMQQANLATTLAAVAELKRPSEEEQERLDAARTRRRNNAAASAAAALQQERESAARQASCSHTKGNDMTAFTGQINSDGCWRAFCPLCHYTSPRIQAESWQINGEGLQLHKMQGRQLTVAMLEALAARTPAPAPLRHVPIGMVPDLSAA